MPASQSDKTLCPFAQDKRRSRLKVLTAHVTGGVASAKMESSEGLFLRVQDLPGPRATNTRAYDAGVHRYLGELHEKYGDIFKVIHEGKQLIVVRDKQRVNMLLTSELFGKTWAGNGLSSSKVEYVMNLIQPMLASKSPFHLTENGGAEDLMRKELKKFFIRPEVFKKHWESQAEEMFKEMPAADGFDVQPLCFDVFEKFVMLILCGDRVQEACEETGTTFKDAFDYFVDRYTTGGHTYTITKADEDAMESLRQASERAVNKVFEGEEPGASDCPALLWEMKLKNYPHHEIVATMVNVMIAAVEAPASAMARTLQELAFNRSLQEDMRHASGDHLEALTMEALRRFAPATLVLREALADVVLGDVLLPKGTVIGICISAVHECPAHFAQPTTFLSDRELDLNSNMFLTFSGGPRGCLGKYFAVQMLQIALSQFSKRFYLMPTEEYVQDSDFPKFMEWSTEGIMLKTLERPNAR